VRPLGTVSLNFSESVVVSDSFAADGGEIRWANVSQSDAGRSIDMVLRESSPSAAAACTGTNGAGTRRPCSGGTEDGFAWVDWKCANQLNSLLFQFEWSDTHESASLPGVDLSIMDIGGYESFYVKASEVENYWHGSTLQASSAVGGSFVRFHAPSNGPASWPTHNDPLALADSVKANGARVF
jgi:hypothetical protein